MFNRPGSLIMALVISVALFYVQQEVLAPQVPPVVVLALGSEKNYVELSGNLFVCSAKQVVEVISSQDLLRYVNNEQGKSILLRYLSRHKLNNGQSYVLNRDSDGLCTIQCAFMSAGRRMSLGVPLHPDHMSAKDWQALPGVGVAMARTITEDKERHGNFYTYETLGRVRGIADKTLDRWREYFY